MIDTVCQYIFAMNVCDASLVQLSSSIERKQPINHNHQDCDPRIESDPPALTVTTF